MMSTSGWMMLLALAALLCCGCSEKPVMTREQIFEQRLSVDTLYRTESGKEFIAPGNKLDVTVDPETNELGWATWKCENPDCPGEGTGDRPYLFIWPNFLAYVDENGEVAFGQPRSAEDLKRFQDFAEEKCPACLENRQIEKETPEQRLQYQNWCKPYVLPQTQVRLAELDEEYDRYLEHLEKTSGN